MQGVLLIDGNSIGFSAQNTRKLKHGDDETQAIFNFLRIMRRVMIDAAGRQPIVFWDGRSWRYEHFPEYKGDRDKDEKTRKDREAYKKQRPHIARAVKMLGIRQSMAKNLEADDLIALTVHKFAGKVPCTIVSGDRDLLQLVGPNVGWHDPRGDDPKKPTKRCNHNDFAEYTGFETTYAFVQGKALIGDASDNLKCSNGLGEAAAPLIMQHFGTVEDMRQKILEQGEDAIPKHLTRYRKKILDFCGTQEKLSDSFKEFLRNMRLMYLKPDLIPKAENYRMVKGDFNEEAFADFCEEFGFVSILKDFDRWISPFKRNL